MSFNINMNMTMDSVINDLLKFQNKLFNNVKKGEAHELRNELNSQYAWERKEGVKRVIANMTVGKDVSSLFPHVVKNMQTEDLEMKKLIYLYLINYAKSQPELVILAVNTFVKDTEDNNPLIRALAIRTMGCIRVDKITDYLCDPLRKALKDDDPYVRKTAAIAVAKLFDINAELCVDNGFILALLELLSDSNPVVVSNAVAALMEINELSPNSKALVVTFPILTKLLRAMNECTEWGQIQIMECLSEYKAQEPREAEGICERILPRLSHANASVVLMAIRLLFINLPQIQNEELKTKVINKIPPALITLLSESSEVQYVLLKNLQLILQKYPDLLNKDIRMFFCKYNDPLYVKLEKLDVIIRLTNEHNCEQVLLELKEYANEVDMDFVKKSIRAIGQLALQVPDVTPKAVQTLVELIQNKVDFVVQEVVVVMKDIFRHYPNQHEGVIPILCEHLDSINSPEAKVSLIWILGEYSAKINNSVDIMTSFLENFTEEPTNVQLMLLTSTVKLFLARPSEAQDLVLKNLKIATEGENPDVRDRAYIYWRLLSTDSQATQKIVLAQKPILSTNLPQLDNQVIERLMKELSSLASVYHKLPETFIQLDRPEVDSVMSLQDHQNSSTLFQASESTQGSSSIPASAQQTLANQEPEELLIAF